MPRQRSPNRERAYKLWKESDGSMLLKDIAAELGVSENQIRKWKNQDRWEQSGKVTLPKGKSNITNQNRKHRTVEDGSLVESVLANEALSEQQRLFCLYFLKCFNATKAYQKAYGVSYESAAANAYRVMALPKVKKEIENLKRYRLNQAMLQEEDIVQRYIDIAFANITDYASFNGEGVKLKDSGEVDGSLIAEVKQGREGVSIKLLDQMKALDWLASHMNLATEEQRARIDKLKLEIGQAKGEMEQNPLAEAAKRMAARRGDGG